MNRKSIALSLFSLVAVSLVAAGQGNDSDLIPPGRPISPDNAPHMEVKQINSGTQDRVYAIIFHKGDDALSGLLHFAMSNNIQDAHFTGIGATSSATLGWLDLSRKGYHPILINEQSEVLSMIGDIALVKGKPSVHTHVVVGDQNGQTKGGHVWKLIVNPTLEVFVTVHPVPLQKKFDPESGMNMIDLQQ